MKRHNKKPARHRCWPDQLRISSVRFNRLHVRSPVRTIPQNLKRAIRAVEWKSDSGCNRHKYYDGERISPSVHRWQGNLTGKRAVRSGRNLNSKPSPKTLVLKSAKDPSRSLTSSYYANRDSEMKAWTYISGREHPLRYDLPLFLLVSSVLQQVCKAVFRQPSSRFQS